MLNMCVYACGGQRPRLDMCACVWRPEGWDMLYMCMCACGGRRPRLVVLSCPDTWGLRQGLSQNRELVLWLDVAISKPQGQALSSPAGTPGVPHSQCKVFSVCHLLTLLLPWIVLTACV